MRTHMRHMPISWLQLYILGSCWLVSTTAMSAESHHFMMSDYANERANRSDKTKTRLFINVLSAAFVRWLSPPRVYW